MGVKVSNDISPESTPDLMHKIHEYSFGGSLPKMLKEERNFTFLAFFFSV